MAKVLLCVTGSIAAYKACDIIRLLKKNGAQVRCVMTACAKEFVTPLTLRTLSENPVYDDMWFESKAPEATIEHIDLSCSNDVILIAPATANIIGKIAGGIANDLLTATVMASDKPVVIAPAMNTRMWKNPIVQENVAKLKKLGYLFVGPKKGELACGEIGEGHIEEVNEIVDKTLKAVKKNFINKQMSGNTLLNNKTILITSGATREPIDAVRFISNPSSGKTGYFLATEAKNRGAKVIFITGKSAYVPQADIIEEVESAQDMLDAVKKHSAKADIIIGAAAVGDFTTDKKNGKLERKDVQTLILKPTKDILAEVGKGKDTKIIVGFAAEVGERTDKAIKKIKNKNLDMIILNDISKKSIGFETDNNKIKAISKTGKIIFSGTGTKEALAGVILDLVESLLKTKKRHG